MIYSDCGIHEAITGNTKWQSKLQKTLQGRSTQSIPSIQALPWPHTLTSRKSDSVLQSSILHLKEQFPFLIACKIIVSLRIDKTQHVNTPTRIFSRSPYMTVDANNKIQESQDKGPKAYLRKLKPYLRHRNLSKEKVWKNKLNCSEGLPLGKGLRKLENGDWKGASHFYIRLFICQSFSSSRTYSILGKNKY